MNAKKRLAAALLALSVCACSAGCANEIEYKSPDNFISSSSSDNPSDSSSEPDEPLEPDAPTDPEAPSDSSSEPDLPKPPTSENLVVKDDDPEYFSKCAFVGEALCSGMSFVNDIADEHIYTSNNAHVHDIGETTWTVDGASHKLPDALYAADRKYIYVWVGPNDLTNYNPNSFAEKYEELVESITYANPMAYVGVVSIAPVSRSYEQGLGGDAIADYNLKLAEMVDRMGNNRVRFFNLVAVLGDNDGFLKGEYDSGDGLHMTASAYRAVAQFLLDNQIHPFLADFEVEIGDVDPENPEGDDPEGTEGENAENPEDGGSEGVETPEGENSEDENPENAENTEE